MKNTLRKHTQPMVISPIFERCHPTTGSGLAGFTVQTPSEPFINHIRFFDSNNRQEKLDELNQLREQLLDMLAKDTPHEDK